MISSHLRHLDEEQLLRYADGELPSRKARQVRSHLEACWQCRSEFEQLQKTVGECVRYRANLARRLPEPPRPWPDIYRKFEEADAAQRATWSARLGEALQFPFRRARRWAPVAAALVLAGALVYQWRETPAVHAAELLRKAAAAADARPQGPRRIQIRTKGRQVTRVIGQIQKSAATPQEAAVGKLFQAAHYDWQDPLSPRAFQNWREQLPSKQDEVTSGPDFYSIRTSTESGELLQASLKLHAPDLQPMEGRFEFRNREWVEISELPPEPPVAVAAVPPAVSSRPAAPPAPAPAGAGDELQVVAALHQVGADLGDPLEISREGAQVVVSGVGIAPSRQQQIQDALAAMPRVVVRFSEPGGAGGHETAGVGADNSGDPQTAELLARLVRDAGGRAQFDRLSSQLLDMSEAMMARVYALRRLAQRFPAEVEKQLEPGERRLLRRLSREHAAALGRETAGMERVLGPLLAIEPPAAPPAVAAAWQAAAGDLFPAARRVETLLAVVTGAAPAGAGGAQLPQQLMTALAEVRGNLEACERLAGE